MGVAVELLVVVSSGCILKVIEMEFANRSDIGCEIVIRTFVLNTAEDCVSRKFRNDQVLS